MIHIKVICISGKAQHGKDTTAQMMKEMLDREGYSTLIIHYADLLKFICTKFFGWNGEKDERGRHILQYVGTDVIREKCPSFWVDFVISVLNLFPESWDFVLIPDCRFPNEIESLQEAGFDAIHLRITRANFESPLPLAQQKHPSETALDDVIPDCYIANNGTLRDLKNEAANLLTLINGYHQMSFDELMEQGEDDYEE